MFVILQIKRIEREQNTLIMQNYVNWSYQYHQNECIAVVIIIIIYKSSAKLKMSIKGLSKRFLKKFFILPPPIEASNLKYTYETPRSKFQISDLIINTTIQLNNRYKLPYN